MSTEKEEGSGSKSRLAEMMSMLSPDDVGILIQAFKLSAAANTCPPIVESKPKQQQQKVELPPVDMKLDGSATYLGWSRRVRYTLEGKDLEGYLTGEKAEPDLTAPERAEWKSTHMHVYIWLLSSLTPAIASQVDGIAKVHDVW